MKRKQKAAAVTIRRMKPIRGGREKVSAALEKAIFKRVEQTATRFNCSRSLVQTVALAQFFGIEQSEKLR